MVRLRKLIVLVVVVATMTGCSGLICRYRVMSHYAWAVEEGYKPEIISYQVSPLWSLGVWDRHIQIRVQQDDRYLWVDDSGESYFLSPSPAFPIGKHYWKFSLQEYMAFLAKYKTYVMENKNLSSAAYQALLINAPRSTELLTAIH